jgi:UDP-N-acetylglucosamine 2-epimerase
MKLIHVVGARPQFVKMAVVSRAITVHNNRVAQGDRIKELIIHTGQHYDENMSAVFFEELEIPKPDYNLGIGSASQGAQTGRMLEAIETVLVDEQPNWVLLYGDTNSTLAGALAAAKLHISVAHIEAGLRSFNKKMPEEINRVLTDHASNVLFCPTETAIENLRREGFTNIVNDGHLVSDSLIPYPVSLNPPFVANIGDVMYDSVLYNLKLAEKRSDILKRLHLFSNDLSVPHNPYSVTPLPNKSKGYALATIHRASNTDDPERLRSIFQALNEIARSVMPVIIPLHPRTRNALSALPRNPLSSTPDSLILIDPVSYLDMLLLEKNAKLILTDSGGVQKEAFILKVPCITLREETEWVETVEAGWNVLLVGADKERIMEAVDHFAPEKCAEAQERDLYGDGHASERIVGVLVSQHK